MKRTSAYEALDGSLHKDKAMAAFASIQHIAKVENRDAREESLGGDHIAFLIQHRKKIANILADIDAPDCDF